jgi:hypothetical protein
MRYILRLNPKAYNPITRDIVASRLWEVEQCVSRDSEKVTWHCADIRIDSAPIREFFKLPKQGEPPWEKVVYGICVRGQDNVVEIHTGSEHDSGN